MFNSCDTEQTLSRDSGSHSCTCDRSLWRPHSALYPSLRIKNLHWIFRKLPADHFPHSAFCKIPLPKSTDLYLLKLLQTVHRHMIKHTRQVFLGHFCRHIGSIDTTVSYLLAYCHGFTEISWSQSAMVPKCPHTYLTTTSCFRWLILLCRSIHMSCSDRVTGRSATFRYHWSQGLRKSTSTQNGLQCTWYNMMN